MTRKKAIGIVVVNVKIGWPLKGWKEVCVSIRGVRFSGHSAFSKPFKGILGWHIPRKWLEKNGHLK